LPSVALASDSKWIDEVLRTSIENDPGAAWTTAAESVNGHVINTQPSFHLQSVTHVEASKVMFTAPPASSSV
jgi:hypothetical protein